MIKINPYSYINKLVILFYFTVIPSFNFAQQISYDESFAESGKLLLDDGGSQISVLQENSEGDIFTFGTYEEEEKSYLIIHKLDKDGHAIQNFGQNGQLQKLLPANFFTINSSLTTENNEMFLSGVIGFPENKTYFAIIKISPEGMIDESFGTDGYFVDSSQLSSFSTKILSYGPGKLLIIRTDGSDESNIKLQCLNSNGNLDTSYGNNGSILVSPPTPYVKLNFDDAVLDGANNLFLLTKAHNKFSEHDFILYKLNNLGKVDNSFNNQGFKVIDIGSFEAGSALILTKRNKLIISGQTSYYVSSIKMYKNKMIVRGFNIDGTTDQNFGNKGSIEYLPDNTGNLTPYSIKEINDNTLIINALNIVNFTSSNIIHTLINNTGAKIVMNNGDLYFSENFQNANSFINNESQDSKGRILSFGRSYSTGVSKSFLCRLLVDTFSSYDQNSDLKNKLEIVPNVVTNNCFLKYQLFSDGVISLYLLSADGKSIKNIFPSQPYKSGSYQLDIDTTNLDKGVYFCKLVTTNGITGAKFIKL